MPVPTWSSRGWPYEKGPTAEAEQAAAAARASARGMARVVPAAAQQRVDGLQQLIRSFSARGLWDLAVKRNGLTTTCLLLGGVLVADALLLPANRAARRQRPSEAQRPPDVPQPQA